MATSSPRWDHYKSFLTVLRTGSLSAAARKLGVKQSTIGRQVEALESELGVSLFTRSPKGLRPTDAALRMRPHLEKLDQTSEALLRDSQTNEADLSGVVCLTASETVASEILPRILLRLRSKLPRVKFEVSITEAFEDLLSREADIAIRSGPLGQKAIVTKKVGELEMGLFASKDYLRGKKIPRTDDDLKDHSLIGLDKTADRVRTVSKLEPLLSRTDFTYFSDSMSFHARLVDAGCAVGLCWADKTATKRVRILPDIHGATFTVWVAMHEDLKKNRKFRAVFSELAALLRAELS